MATILSATFLVGVLTAMLRIATPLLFGTLGELFNERSGILNLGIEGIMTLGALTAFVTVRLTGSLYLGLATAAMAGILASMILGFLTVTLGLSQHVSGIGLTFAATGISYFIYRLVVGTPPVPPTVTTFKTIAIPLLSRIPVLGPVLFRQYGLVYLALILVPVIHFVMFRTTLGLRIRTCGENPAAADSMGVGVHKTRYTSLAIGGALIALGGAFLSTAQVNMFIFGMVAGRGWVCIALVVFGNWKPYRILIGALVFGLIDAFQLRLQQLGLDIPYQLFLMLPYLATIVVLVVASRRANYPAALLKPYMREE